MFCPKCNGGTFISDEDVVKVLETTQPIRLVLKTTFVCRSCSEKFSRVVVEDIEAKRQMPQQQPAPGYPTSPEALQPGMSTTGQYQQGSSYQPQPPPQEHADKLKFLDNI